MDCLAITISLFSASASHNNFVYEVIHSNPTYISFCKAYTTFANRIAMSLYAIMEISMSFILLCMFNHGLYSLNQSLIKEILDENFLLEKRRKERKIKTIQNIDEQNSVDQCEGEKHQREKVQYLILKNILQSL